MKFEKFVKKVMPNGRTEKLDGKNWLTDGAMFARIPALYGTMGIETKDVDTLDFILHEAEWGEKEAKLERAYLPFSDSKGKDIIRVFDDGTHAVDITNEQYGMIEKGDKCFIAYGTMNEGEEDEKDITALLVGVPAEIDNFTPDAVILNV